ncbi:lamin tail domain-containing protein [Actinoplanes sp. NPDC049118]|uniref:lamin tail domain-containing protein n=1 Tax=Actinoplanes sp. NPDC049118 TaxID=3155769 RepID=UPI0033C42CA0
MRRTISILAATTMAVAGSLAIGAPASAATPSLRFHGAQYDSPGKDNRSNASLNSEWISLINSGNKPVNLSRYTIRDASNHVYTFGNVTIAAKGGRIWLHTGKGTRSGRVVYWGSGNYIWNNTGDTATLRNAAGKNLDACSWSSRKDRVWVAC